MNVKIFFSKRIIVIGNIHNLHNIFWDKVVIVSKLFSSFNTNIYILRPRHTFEFFVVHGKGCRTNIKTNKSYKIIIDIDTSCGLLFCILYDNVRDKNALQKQGSD